MSNPYTEPNPFEDQSAVVDASYAGGESRTNLVAPAQTTWAPSGSTTPGGTPIELALRQREEELKRREQKLAYREAKLDEREVKLQDYGQIPNWPSCKPIIYHDINKDIPEGGRQLVKRLYFAWFIAVWVYAVNVVSSLVLMTAKATAAGGNFGMALIILFIGTPVSFVFWYQPLYNGVKLDRSMPMFIFFVCYGFHLAATGLLAVGVQGWGGAGFIYIFETFTAGQLAPGIFCMISFASMVFECVYGLWQLKAVQAYYRNKGMSVQKAQEEAAVTVATSNVGREFAAAGARAATANNL